MVASLLHLLRLYYTRHIPLTIFWGLYSILPVEKLSRGLLKFVLVALLLVLGYSLGWILILFHLVFLFNILLAYNFHTTILPILLIQEPFIKFGPKTTNGILYSFLLSRLIYRKKFSLPLKFLLRLIEFFALISIGIGLVDLSNDFASHASPDLFDLLFPLYGALPFFGGVTLLSLTSFFLYFIFPSGNIQKWKRRQRASLGFSSHLRKYVISPDLLHPYFFLTPKGRFLTAKRAISDKSLTLLLEKALLDNKDRIPAKWLKQV